LQPPSLFHPSSSSFSSSRLSISHHKMPLPIKKYSESSSISPTVYLLLRPVEQSPDQLASEPLFRNHSQIRAPGESVSRNFTYHPSHSKLERERAFFLFQLHTQTSKYLSPNSPKDLLIISLALSFSLPLLAASASPCPIL
jgi:hypothetical protein